jgi:hypothetical protein
MAPDPEPTPHRNRLLRLLSSADLALLKPHLDRQELSERTYLETPNRPVKAAFFTETGIASVVAGANGRTVEVGEIGYEGMTGQIVVMGNDRSPNETYIQVAGEGLCIPAAKLREANG